MPGALTKEQMEQDRRQYQPAMPDYFMNANHDDDGSDKYTNVNLGVKSFWGSLGTDGNQFYVWQKRSANEYAVMVFLQLFRYRMPIPTALHRNIFWIKKSSDFITK